MSAVPASGPAGQRHSLVDDLQGLVTGTLFVAIGLGGLNVLVLWLQQRFGWRAGTLQLRIDISILLCALPWRNAGQLALSVLGAVAMNFALAINHKPGRYTAF